MNFDDLSYFFPVLIYFLHNLFFYSNFAKGNGKILLPIFNFNRATCLVSASFPKNKQKFDSKSYFFIH